MGNLLKTIKRAYHRRKAIKYLEQWERHHSHVHGHILTRKFELADMYADLYWYAPVNGMKEQVMYQRHTFKSMNEHLEYDEQELLPKCIASFEKQ